MRTRGPFSTLPHPTAVLLLIVLATTSCSTVSSRQASLIEANYRSLKKYDLLERTLTDRFSRAEASGDILAQLYNSLDLADLYTYGLINFRRAITLYGRAASLNEQANRRAGSDS